MSFVRSLSVMALLVSACASDAPYASAIDPAAIAHPPAGRPPSSEPETPPGSATTSPAATPPALPAASASGGPASPPTLPSLELSELRRAVQEPVVALGVDTQKGRVAALGKSGCQTFMDRGQGWTPVPIPTALCASAGERDEARIYFGRDNEARIMGTRLGSDGPRQLYLRYHRGVWKPWPRELASFAGKPHAALYGVLGWDDPEVVCKVGDFCLIKQRRGWSQVPLPVDPPTRAIRIDLGADGAYALLARKLLRLGERSWQPMGGEGRWKGRPASAWIREDQAWVSAPEEDALYRLDGGRWHRHASPVRTPRGLWSHARGTVWVVGRDGGAFFDGRHWSRIGGLPGPLAEVIGHQGSIWFAGESGIWQARLPARLAPQPPSPRE